MHTSRSFGSIAVLCALALSLAVDATAEGPYHVEARWKVGGEGGWDYMAVDSAAHRLYLTHGTRVDVLDTGTGKIAGSITGLRGTHGVVFDETGAYGYISDSRANAVVVFDRHTLQRYNRSRRGSIRMGLLMNRLRRRYGRLTGSARMQP